MPPCDCAFFPKFHKKQGFGRISPGSLFCFLRICIGFTHLFPYKMIGQKNGAFSPDFVEEQEANPKCKKGKRKRQLPQEAAVSFGGERGIRTLERVLTVTRFPIVRLRPAQPSLQAIVPGHPNNELYYNSFLPIVKP